MKIPSTKQFNPIIRTIDNKLYAGKKPTLSTLKNLKNNGIETVIDLRPAKQWSGVLLEKLKCILINIPHIWHPINLAEKMPEKEELINLNKIINKNSKTFVHCRSGIHSTNIVCGASSILRGEKTLDEILENIIQSNYFYTKPNIKKTNNKINLRQKKLNRLAQRLNEFAEMFNTQIKK